MPDPEGFKLGQAWMAVRPNIDEAEFKAKIAAAVASAQPDSDAMGRDLGAALSRGVAAGARDSGAARGVETFWSDAIGRDLGEGIRDAIPAAREGGAQVGDQIAAGAAGRLRDERGRFVAVGKQVGDDVAEGLKQGLPASLPELIPPVADNPRRPKEDGQKTGSAFAEGMSPLIATALAGAVAVGPATFVAGLSAALVAGTAMITRNNAQLTDDYHQLGTNLSTDLQAAAEPALGAIDISLNRMAQTAQQVEPAVHNIFANTTPDITQFAGGITGLAVNTLPGLQQATANGQVIVQKFAGSLPGLGTGIGNFFAGLTRDASATASGIESVVGTASHAVDTLGGVLGSGSAAVSEDLQAIDPVVNGLLTGVQKLADPATVGGVVGLFGAMKLDPLISSGLQTASNGLTTLAAKADGARGLLGKAGGAAESAAGGLGKMADVMAGPWGLAIGAGVGLVGGLVASLSQASVTASDFTSAVSEDSGVVGANTEATIQQTLAKQDLSALTQQLGVSSSTLIAYASGEASAQQEVTDAYNKKVAAMSAEDKANRVAMSGRNSGLQQQDTQLLQLQQAKIRIDDVTKAVADSVKQNNEDTKSLQAAEQATDVFDASVRSAVLALNQQTITARINATAMNDSLAPAGRLTQEAIGQTLAFGQAQQATSFYTSALNAMVGPTDQSADAQAKFSIALDNLKGQITSGKDAMDLNTAAGAKNFEMFQSVAGAAESYAEKLYQQTGNSKTADTALQNSATQLDNAAKAAHLTDKQIAQLNTDLFGVPDVKDIHISADTSAAQIAIERLNNQLNNLTYATLHPGGGLGAGHGALAGNASGGFVPAGSWREVGEHGTEKMYVGQDAYVLTHGQSVAAESRPGADVRPIENHFHYYGTAQPSPEQKADMLRQLAAVLV